jgi:hypothetical protein
MFVERKLNHADHTVELWRCEWENHAGGAAKKVYLEKIGVEQPVNPDTGAPMAEEPAICWSYGRTLGNIAVYARGV